MNKKKKISIFILIFILFFVIVSIFYSKLSKEIEPDQAKKPTQIVKAPDINILDYKGNEVKLSQMFGKPIVINFWASWCPNCIAEMPYFNNIYKEKGSDVTFMMIDLIDNKRETIEIGTEFIDNEGYNFPVYFDHKQEAQQIYHVYSLPTTIFIDKNGQIISSKKGTISEKDLVSNIDLICE